MDETATLKKETDQASNLIGVRLEMSKPMANCSACLNRKPEYIAS